MRAQAPAPLRFVISFPSTLSAQPLDGRVLLFISELDTPEPRNQTDRCTAPTARGRSSAWTWTV